MANFPERGVVTLRTNLADYPTVAALKSGQVKSDLVTLDFCGPKTANEGFKPMLREEKFDAGELAIVSYLQALAYGKPYVMLPAPVLSRFQHHCILYNASRGELKPKDIEGRRIGTRSYTVTTGVWVRGILQHDYGVDPSRVTWATLDDAHLAEYRDPANTERLPAGSKIEPMLLEGALDGAILAHDLPDEKRVRHLIPNPREAALAWHRKHGAISINHVFVVHRDLSQQRPDVVREIYRMLKESKQAAGAASSGIDMFPFGVEANRRNLEMIVQFAVEQSIIPRRLAVEELFDQTTIGLN